MEYDTTGYYYGGRIYYSPTLGRPLQQVNPSGSIGGVGGFNATISSALSSGGGFDAANFGVHAGASAADATAAFAFASGAGAGADAAGAAVFGGANFWNPVGWAALAVAAILEILDLFGVFGGGGHAAIIPNGYYRLAHYIASEFLGVPYEITPTWKIPRPRKLP
jgi:hypothetical protein